MDVIRTLYQTITFFPYIFFPNQKWNTVAETGSKLPRIIFFFEFLPEYMAIPSKNYISQYSLQVDVATWLNFGQ